MKCARALGLVAMLVPMMAGNASAGGTFELGFGGGYESVHTGGRTTTRSAFSSPTIAAGGRLGERTWLLGRISLVFAKSAMADGQTTTFAFFGGSLQYFPTDRFFIAGGLGAVEQDFERIPDTNTTGYLGVALDLRAGINLFPDYRHTILLQVELTPTIYKDSTSVGTVLLASYQYL